MRGDDRREAIIELLLAQESATIPELVARFGVSHMTIRRDLDALAEEVTVDHGQAQLLQNSGVEPRYAAKQRVNASLKAQIARYAAEHFVQDGDVILLEGGTTVTAMARCRRSTPGRCSCRRRDSRSNTDSPIPTHWRPRFGGRWCVAQSESSSCSTQRSLASCHWSQSPPPTA